jgi:hypothetical protein
MISYKLLTERQGGVVMLKIVFGDVPNSVYHPPVYFDNRYLDEWITDPMSVEMIKDVDGSRVIGQHLIESPVLGPIPPRDLSGGVKTLMLMKFDESGKIFNASACGDNCASWICRIAEEKDLTINLHHIMDFSHVKNFHAHVVNTERDVNDFREFVDEAIDIRER